MSPKRVKGRKCYEYFCDLPGVCSLCRSDQIFAGKTLRGEWYSHRSGKAYDLLETPILNENGVLSKLSILHLRVLGEKGRENEGGTEK